MHHNGRLEGGEYNLSRRTDEAIPRSRSDEELIWVDRFGTLLISKVAHDSGAAYSLRLADQIRVEVVNGKPTNLETACDVSDETISHFFDDQVLPRILSAEGKFILHAAAIDIGGSVILLMGDSGLGKSTLAASFHQQGFQLLGDDAIIIDECEQRFSATPVYPSLRLFPDSLTSIFPDVADSRQTSQHSAKRNVEFTFTASTHDHPIPIVAAIILSAEAASEPALQRLGKADACMQLVQNSFALDPIESEIATEKLNFAGAIANTVPVYSFSYPRDFRRLFEVSLVLLDGI